MSETYLSLNDFYEFKHVRTLKNRLSNLSQKKKLTLFYLNKAMLAKEYVKTNLSCDCTEFGICNQFIRRIKKQYPFNGTRYLINKIQRWQRRKKVLKRFKAAINAILFILSYKVETIKKFRKRMHILKAMRNLTTIKKSQITVFNHQQHKPIISIPQSRQSLRIKTTPDDETFFHHTANSAREPRKSQVSLYMDKMLKDVIPKFVAHLKPLSYLNQKLIKQNSAKSITQASFSQFNNLQVQSNLQRFPTVHVESIANNQYKMNNKDLLKLIDSLKVRHRIIRCKK
ncbi:unnamed protein product (macronuclear) [Paramecium tetraurelia]|uniref:Uncharacterized protein n=1 Tax=Paramecium tetraurelia TaxID=5888 RepID=A0DQU1_PARTE|nr:uncharacterized protein GSPATT00002808001 [Paramecium tetraurelia]CAK85408.1 unnamed protein product [Paramecium tetraurelia]|eukprot:XP_001452805.1 hypothetical protein (macronuclear) [Paramecium tetraurelia strain d4-2]